MRNAMRKPLTTLAVLFVTVVAGAGVIGFRYVREIHEPYQGYAAPEQFVEIAPGSGAAEIRRRLVAARVVRDEGAFGTALWWTGRSRVLQAGEYRFDRPMSPVEVVEKIAAGDVYARKLTFPEGLTIREMAALYESRGFGEAGAFLAAAQDTSGITDLDPEASDLEGYLFPETYPVARGTPASKLVAMMVDRFKATYTEPMREQTRAQGETVREVVTLASLIEKETAKSDERPLVAAVYRNRLRLGMAMQADPTVVFALVKAGKYDGNIRRDDLAFNSPYNTYRHPGLPPGPIAAPGARSLQAALAPADVAHLYFVSRNDGSHVFARTLAEHNANVHEHQVLYFRKQRQNDGARGSRPGARTAR